MVPLGAAVGEADRRVAVALVFTLSVLLLLFGSGAIDGFDGQAMYLTTESLVRAGDLSISAPFGDAGLGGSYSRYGPALSVLGIVPFLLAMPLADWVGVPQVLERAAVASLMPIICACLVVALYMLARRLGGGARSSLLVACGALFGTFLLPYSHDFFSEPLTALGLTLALERALARRPGQAGLALGLAIVARPQAAVMIPFLLLVGSGGGRAVIRAFAAPAASIAGLALVWLGSTASMASRCCWSEQTLDAGPEIYGRSPADVGRRPRRLSSRRTPARAATPRSAQPPLERRSAPATRAAARPSRPRASDAEHRP